MINIFGFASMRAAAKGPDRGILGAELSARFGALVGSAILQITLTIAALAKDPALVILFDGLGAILVVLLMLRRGIGMVLSGMASLFDRPAPHSEMTSLRQAIEATLPPGCLAGLRTRRGGDRLFVEVGVRVGAFDDLHGLSRHTVALKRAVADFDTARRSRGRDPLAVDLPGFQPDEENSWRRAVFRLFRHRCAGPPGQ